MTILLYNCAEIDSYPETNGEFLLDHPFLYDYVFNDKKRGLYRPFYFSFAHTWLATVQDVLHADWQED